MQRLLVLALAVSLTLAALSAGAARPATSAPLSTASCDQIALRFRSSSESGYRVILGKIAVADKRYAGTTARRRHGEPWPYFREAWLVVRAGASPVTVTVPEGWRQRVAISWGNTPAVSSLRIASCGASGSKPWNAYAGGFHLRSRADCVPLDFQVGGLSTSVRFGVGRACGAGSR